MFLKGSFVFLEERSLASYFKGEEHRELGWRYFSKTELWKWGGGWVLVENQAAPLCTL